MKLKSGTITYSTHSYISFDCDAGSAKVNVSTDEVIFSHNDISVGEGTFNMGISHIHSNYLHLDDTHMGLCWKLNIQHYLKKYDGSVSLKDFTTDDYVYVDGEGYVHRFVRFDNYRYIDKSGHGMILTVGSISQIQMPNGNILYFNSDGNLYKISIVGKKQRIFRNIDYEDGYIKKYYDTRCTGTRERYFSFDYKDGLLNKISLISKGKVLETIFYNYNDGKLQGIYHFINDALASISLFKYEYGRIIFATGTSNGIALALKYKSNSVKVKKGLSKIKKSAYNCLNDDVTLGELYPNDYIEPQIGVKETKNNTGLFIVENLDDGLYYLGDEIAFESLEDELILNNTYEAFELSNDEIFETTDFEYTLCNHTNIISGKGINYRYYYNNKGFVVSTFEVDGKNLMTLTKDSGIAISYTVSDSYPYERINNKIISNAALNQEIKCLDSDGLVNGFDGGPRLKNYRETLGWQYVNYTASFWIKVTSLNASYIKVSFEIFNYEWIKNEIYIDHTASGAWQYVTIPFSIRNDDQSKKYDFSSAFIKATSDGSGEYDVSNLRIEEGMHSKMQLNGSYLTYSTPSISEYYKVKLLLNNGASQEIIFDNKNFISESDVFATCKNMHNSKSFDFVYCANTKRIANVKEIYFRVLEKQDYTSYQDEYQMYGIGSVKITSHSPDSSCETTKHYDYDNDSNLKEYTYSNHGGSIESLLDSQGRIIYEIDSHGKKTVNEYDEYGNIVSTTTSLKDNFDSNNKIIVGKERFYTRYDYDDESNGGMYREMVVNTTVQDSSIKIKKSPQMVNNIESIQVGDNYAQFYNYDILNRIKDISISYDFGKFIRNCYEYDSLGRLKKVTDNSKFCYELDYDKYGNINRYNIRKYDGSITAIKSKETIPNNSSYGGDTQIEINHLTNSVITTENDKYGRPIKTVFNNKGLNKSVLYEYQEHNSSINTNSYQSGLHESPSIAKIKKIQDGCDNSTTTFLYDNKNDDCGYTIKRNNVEIQRIQQMDSNSTKYVLGSTKYKTTIEKENNYYDPRITKTSVSWDNDTDAKDEWDELDKYTFTYTYDDVLGIPITKNGSASSTVASYKPNDGSKYYSNQVQSYFSKIGSNSYNYTYQYDNNQNIHRIVSDHCGANDITYSYDKLNRLKTEYNQKQATNYTYSYLDSNNNDINRVTKVISGTTKVKEFEYDELNRLTNYKNNGTILTSLTYDGNNLNPSYIKKNGALKYLKWDRDNLLSSFGNNYYNYNYQGNRISKTTSTETISYYYDGSKLLGEDHSTGVKIRYIYDLMGITGARYITSSGITDYHYAKDGQGNIVAILKDGNVVTQYYYDAWGNTLEEVINQNDPFAKVNPFRWRCNYYDVETNMYYINGRYYDPELFSYIDSLDIENVVSSSNIIGGLNPYAICTDNPTDLKEADFSILTNTDLMPDPVYDPLVGYSWWDKNWKNVIRYGLFTLTFVTSIVLMCIPGTQAFGIGMFEAGLGAALSGMVIGGVISGIISAIQGNGFFTGFADGAITGFVDGFTAGAILYCVSSAVNAISKSLKAANKTTIKVDGQKIKIKNAKRSDFTDEAWNEIQSLSKNQAGETISNMAGGRKIHAGYKKGMSGKEVFTPSKTGRMDYFDKTRGIIYELKPKNSISISSGINQLLRYNKEFNNACKLVIVLY